jgi:hypothetical protein
MRTFLTILCVLSAAAMLDGCVNVDADASKFSLGGNDRHESAPPINPDSDPRSVADLRKENAQLRQRMTTLEDEHTRWQAVIDQQKQEVKFLKKDRDAVKKDRDHYKKLLKKEDD